MIKKLLKFTLIGIIVSVTATMLALSMLIKLVKLVKDK